jgi:hypothetical protein
MLEEIVLHPDGTLQIRGRYLEIDREVSVFGKRGRYRYKGYSHTSEGKLNLHFIGGPPGREMYHSFYPGEIRRIHNKKEQKKRV